MPRRRRKKPSPSKRANPPDWKALAKKRAHRTSEAPVGVIDAARRSEYPPSRHRKQSPRKFSGRSLSLPKLPVFRGGRGLHKLLPLDELTEVLGSENRRDLLIGGEFIPARSAILLYRGDLGPITVPLSWFSPRPGSPEPDATRLAVTDYGQTVRLGEYEAAAEAILYEFDEEYRQRAKKRMSEKDTSLGGAIRRLRLQKGLRQTDFPGITAREIARIEKGLIQRPREETLQRIGKRTSVPVDQLQTY